MNDAGLAPVPDGVVTEIGPVVAPGGTMVVIWLSEMTVNVAAAPLNVTEVAPVKALPLIVTDEPGQPELGVNEETAGGGGGTGVGIGRGVAVAPLLGAVQGRNSCRGRPRGRSGCRRCHRLTRP